MPKFEGVCRIKGKGDELGMDRVTDGDCILMTLMSLGIGLADISHL